MARLSDDALDEALGALPQRDPSGDLAAGVMARLAEDPRPTREARKPAWWRGPLWASGGLTAGAALTVLIMLLATPPTFGPLPEPVDQVQEQVALPAPCRVRRLRGEVIRQKDGVAQRLKAGDRLHPEDVLRTGADARAELDVDADAMLIVHRDSQLQIGPLDVSLRAFVLSQGRVSVEVINGGARRVRVSAADLQASIEGGHGAFVAMVPAADRAAFGVLSGEASVRLRSGEQRLEAGQVIRLDREAVRTGTEPLPEQVQLSIDEPRGPLIARARVALRGEASSHARVWLDGQNLPLDAQGRFSTTLPVEPDQVLLAQAEDLLGNTKQIELGPAVRPRARHKPVPPPARKVEVKSYKVNW